jgi:hypothetical protein
MGEIWMRRHCLLVKSDEGDGNFNQVARVGRVQKPKDFFIRYRIMMSRPTTGG